MKLFSLSTVLASLVAALFLAGPLQAQNLARIVPDGKPHRFEMRGKQFLIDGEPTLLAAGEMHFGRVQPEDWERRIKQAKAMGLNAVSFYLFWNLCEPQEGKFVFAGMTDVRRALQLCQENGLWAILRPGPYCCAEVEYGGIPWWTVLHPEVKIRTEDPRWLGWTRRYIGEVMKQVGDLQVTRGGPLLMVQLDNEYVMLANGDYSYIGALEKVFREAGVEVPLFTCDPILVPEKKAGSTPPDVMRGHNGLRVDRDYEKTAKITGDLPVYVPELYTAWFSAWGSPPATRYTSVDQIRSWTSGLIDKNVSFCYYMFFGGTTYGFFSGANEALPLISSYDYSAPVDEAGRTTEKYHALRALLTERLKIAPPPVPPEPEVISVPAVRLDTQVPLLATLPSAPTRTAEKPLSMEELGQDYGYVLYRHVFPDGVKGVLKLEDARDYTLVMVNGRTVHRAFLGDGEDTDHCALDEKGPATLDLLVHNLGRISVITASWSQGRARKGLVGPVTLDGVELRGWEMYSLPCADISGPKPVKDAGSGGPAFYTGTFEVEKLGGTFLDMRNWSFGAVWVNGHNLGRFWDRGSVRSLFVPSHWLKKGKNEVVVLELLDAPKTPEISGGTKIVQGEPRPFAVRLDQAGRRPKPKRTNSP